MALIKNDSYLKKTSSYKYGAVLNNNLFNPWNKEENFQTVSLEAIKKAKNDIKSQSLENRLTKTNAKFLQKQLNRIASSSNLYEELLKEIEKKITAVDFEKLNSNLSKMDTINKWAVLINLYNENDLNANKIETAINNTLISAGESFEIVLAYFGNLVIENLKERTINELLKKMFNTNLGLSKQTGAEHSGFRYRVLWELNDDEELPDEIDETIKNGDFVVKTVHSQQKTDVQIAYVYDEYEQKIAYITAKNYEDYSSIKIVDGMRLFTMIILWNDKNAGNYYIRAMRGNGAWISHHKEALKTISIQSLLGAQIKEKNSLSNALVINDRNDKKNPIKVFDTKTLVNYLDNEDILNRISGYNKVLGMSFNYSMHKKDIYAELNNTIITLHLKNLLNVIK